MKRRAKLYHLSEEGNWIDKGTGWVDIDNFVCCTVVGLANYANIRQHLVMDSEDENGKKLLQVPISFAPDYYQREGGLLSLSPCAHSSILNFAHTRSLTDTLIIWTDQETQVDMAFSFLTAEGASEIWSGIDACALCRNSPLQATAAKLPPVQVHRNVSTCGRFVFMCLAFDRILRSQRCRHLPSRTWFHCCSTSSRTPLLSPNLRS